MVAAEARAGRYVQQPAGYRAFIPAPIPPSPPLNIDMAMLGLLDRALVALRRLAGASQILPNPGLFVAMYVRREAVLSSQIEGTQSTLEDVLTFELKGRILDIPRDVGRREGCSTCWATVPPQQRTRRRVELRQPSREMVLVARVVRS